MADIRNDFVGIESPNPSWLASAPPPDKARNAIHAFKAGRPRLELNNIELIAERELQTDLREIEQVEKNWPDRTALVSPMVPCEEDCVGCNLCVNVCPVEGCIDMVVLRPGTLDRRTGGKVEGEYANWTTHPNNPMARTAAE